MRRAAAWRSTSEARKRMSSCFSSSIRSQPIIETVGAVRASPIFREQCLVGGEWVNAAHWKEFQVCDPGLGEVVGSVPDMGAEGTETAIEVASEAMGKWKQATAAKRSRLLQSWADVCSRHSTDLAKIVSLESGKSMPESRGEVAGGIAFLELYARLCLQSVGSLVPAPSGSQRLLTMAEPVGPCSLITPFNFPMMMVTRKLGAAVAAGCTAVLKPAEDTPLTALALGACAQEAGIPPGVVNIITCSDEGVGQVGAAMTAHPLVKKVSFTGSKAVGKLLLQQASDSVKKVSLELGGNAPFLVFEDADIDASVQGLVASKWRFNGQTCICPNRALIHSSVYEQFLSKLTAAVAKVKCGPLINREARERVLSLIHDALDNGATALTGQDSWDGSAGDLQPTLLVNCSTQLRCYREEVFGPVLPILSFASEEEALSMANDLGGLAAYVYTQSQARGFRMAEGLEAGMVGVNEAVISKPAMPFGGVKDSGIGREGGEDGLRDFQQVKAITLGGM